jgi:monoamine oxidase
MNANKYKNATTLPPSASPTLTASGMHDIIIIGAGVSSLAAIVEITKFNNNNKHNLKRPISYLVLESNHRVGGRVLTIPWIIDNKEYHVDFGGTWLHGIVGHPFIANNLVHKDTDLINISTKNFWTSKKIFNKHYDKYDRELHLYITKHEENKSGEDNSDEVKEYANDTGKIRKSLSAYEKSIILGITQPPSIHNKLDSKKQEEQEYRLNNFTNKHGRKKPEKVKPSNTNVGENTDRNNMRNAIKVLDDDHGEHLKVSIDKMFKDVYQICLNEIEKFHVKNKINLKVTDPSNIVYDGIVTMNDIFDDYFVLLKDLFYVETNDLNVLKWVVKCHEIWFGCTMENITCKEWIDTAPPPPPVDDGESVNADGSICNNKSTVLNNDGSNWGDLPGPHALIRDGVGYTITKHLKKYSDHIQLNRKVIEINYTNRNEMTVHAIIEDGATASSTSDMSGTNKFAHISKTNDITSNTANEAKRNAMTYQSKYILNTIPLSLYKTIKYKPYFPRDKISGLDQISMTSYFKVFLAFHEDDIFWDKEITWIGNVTGGDTIANPYIMFFNYYKFTKAPILVAFAYGNIANELENMGIMKQKPLSPVRPIASTEPKYATPILTQVSSNIDDDSCMMKEATEAPSTNNSNMNNNLEAPVIIALKTLENIFNITNLKFKLHSSKLTTWNIDKHSKGAYPFGIPRMTQNPNSDKTNIYFSGDGVTTNNDEGSLAAAYDTGQLAMLNIINKLKHELLVNIENEKDSDQTIPMHKLSHLSSSKKKKSTTPKLSPIQIEELERRMKKGSSAGQKIIILS